MDGPYDNRILPVLLSLVMITFLSVVFVGTLVDFAE